MKTFALNGTAREQLGKKATKADRVNGTIPCVLYGGSEVTHFTVAEGDVRKLIFTPEIFLVELTIGGKKANAIVKDLQFHPVSDRVLHIDFLEVFTDKPVAMNVPVKLVGLPEGVKMGGKLSQEMRYLKVKAAYTAIPENLVVNVENLALGKTIQVGALSFDGLEILNNPNNVVAAVKLTRAARGKMQQQG
jgi:large subunit ribosomal protein L25